MIARALLAVVVLAAALPCAAQPTPAEEQAIAAGKAADAAALRRMVERGDAHGVRSFSRGMSFARIDVMPPDIESVVVAGFDDSRVGEALRDLSPRYRTRALFDRHYARITAAYRADEPSFRQILRTDQPGIDEALLRVAEKFPTQGHELNPVMIFTGERKHPAAIPMLVASIEQGYRVLGSSPPMHNRAVSLLLAYPSPDAWRRARDEIERLNGAGRLTPQAYAAGREQLDRVLADPGATLARMRRNDIRLEFERRSAAVSPSESELDAIRDSAPADYVARMRTRVDALDRIAHDLDDESVRYSVGGQYLYLGLFVRFRLRDARAALPLLEKAADYRQSMGQLALADTYQIELRDKPNAIRAYEAALAEASRPTEGRPFFPYTRSGSQTNQFWRAWLAYEIAYLQGGKRPREPIAEDVIAGFFDMVFGNAGAFVEPLAASLPMEPLPGGGLRLPMYVRALPEVQSWDDGRDSLERIDRAQLAERLRSLPSSRLVLFVALRPISALPARDIVRELARHDPSGYWTACALGTVDYLASKGAAGRDEAVRNGTAQLMPGFTAPGKPNALASAAAQFLAAQGLKVRTNPRR